MLRDVYELLTGKRHDPPRRRLTPEQWDGYELGYDYALVIALRVLQGAKDAYAALEQDCQRRRNAPRRAVAREAAPSPPVTESSASIHAAALEDVQQSVKLLTETLVGVFRAVGDVQQRLDAIRQQQRERGTVEPFPRAGDGISRGNTGSF